MAQKERVAAVDGLFTLDEKAPALIGSRCSTCGTYYFPKETVLCRHPKCWSQDLPEVTLSRRGTVWSYTNACYAPPAPFVASEPFEPFAIAAVELEKEKLTVLGQLPAGVGIDAIDVGDEVELRLGTLHEDDDKIYLTWQWQPTGTR